MASATNRRASSRLSIVWPAVAGSGSSGSAKPGPSRDDELAVRGARLERVLLPATCRGARRPTLAGLVPIRPAQGATSIRITPFDRRRLTYWPVSVLRTSCSPTGWPAGCACSRARCSTSHCRFSSTRRRSRSSGGRSRNVRAIGGSSSDDGICVVENQVHWRRSGCRSTQTERRRPPRRTASESQCVSTTRWHVRSRARRYC